MALTLKAIKNHHIREKTIMPIIQRKIGVDLQKILRWMKTFGEQYEKSFWEKIMKI